MRPVTAGTARRRMADPPRRRARGASARVLPGELRGRALLLLLLPVEPRLPPPGALEVVAHAHAEPTHPLDLELDEVAVLERREPAVVGAAGEHVARLERVDGGDPLDAARDLVGHVARAEVLLERAVDPQLHLVLERVWHLVRRLQVLADV